ncbi:MAG: DNA gyrase inhibitor YacG [Phycisphaerae bacterium]|nr:DNA gyrase inhibitor YacG [Phycisphaerae bacterium]
MSGREKCRSCGRKLPAKAKERSPWYPFCSQRCRWVDLGRWFDQKYGLTETNGPLSGREDQEGRTSGDKAEGE